jgi:hypothetical protein
VDTKCAASSRPFRYLADPLCIAALSLYALNRFYLKPHHIGGWFTHGYLNDVLCLPLFVPIILYTQHLLHLRPHYKSPSLWEIVQAFLAFSIVFQLIIPRFPHTFTTAGDPLDILAYAAGGILAHAWWAVAWSAAFRAVVGEARGLPRR